MLFLSKNNLLHILLYLTVIIATLPGVIFAVATVYAPGDSVTVGEFVFNDDFTPTTDVCSVQVYSPAGTLIVNASTTLGTAGWQFYTFTASSTNGTYPSFISCGSLIAGNFIKSEKTFIVKTPSVTNDSIATSVWANGTRTITSLGAAAADVWNDSYSGVRRLTDSVLGGGGNLATQAYVASSTNAIIAEIATNRSLIQSLNNVSAADVWAHGARTITGNVNLSTLSKQEIWDVAASGLSTSGSIGKKIADNLDVAISTRGTSNLSAADVWASASRSLTDYATTSITSAIWGSAARTLTNYGNDITAADVWNVLSSAVTTNGSIGKQLKDNVNDSISNVIAEVQTNRTLINALNNISAADVWAHGARTITGNVNLTASSTQSIWDIASTGLTTSGSIGKKIADNLDVQVSTRSTSTLTAADVWNVANRTLSDYATSSITAAIWANGSRTLTNYGNDITAADVWNTLTSSISTNGSIGKQLKDNVDGTISGVVAEIQTNRSLIQALNNISAADVWTYGARSVNSAVDISASSSQQIWNVAASGLSTSGSIGKKIVDNLDATISSRGISNLTAADVWNSASRTLSDYGTSSIASAIWSSASRTLTSYGNDITAADVWNVLSTSITTNGSIGKQLKDNVDGSISNVVLEIQTNRALIQSLNNISAADVWAHGARTITGNVNLSTSSKQEIWNIATADLSTTGSIGKKIVDNLDAQVSSRGVSNITAADVWASASRTLTDYGTSSIAAAVWANASRTLSNYGNDITAEDVWNVLSSSLTQAGSIGKQLTENIDGSISNVVSEIQTNRALIQALNNVSAADVWAHGARTITGNVNISTSSTQQIWDVAVSGLTTTGSVGKQIVDNLDAQISSRGTGSSNLTAADVWANASRTLSDYGTSSLAAAVWSNASRTLSNYGNDITAADVWNVLSGTLTSVGSIGKQLADNVDGSISNVVTEVQMNRTLIQALNNISAADVWAHGTRSVTGSVYLSTSSLQQIWNVAAADLSSSGSIGKRIVDNLDTQVSTRGISNITAADVWASASRTLSDYGTSSVAAAVWSNASRTLSSYGNDITAADVWNVLSSSLTTVGSIGKQLKDNVNESISNVISEVQTNRTLINSMNDISAADVWAHGARTITGNVNLTASSSQAIWDVAASSIITSGSIGKQIKDNIDVQISTRGVSNLTASDVWSATTRTLSDYATSSISAAIWANSSRTLSSYGNDITAADVWNVLSSSLSTNGSIGKQLKDNVNDSISNVIGEVLTNRTLIQALNNVSAADVWAYGARTITGNVNLSASSTQQIWNVASADLSTSGSVGKRIVDNLDAQISSRGTGTSNLTAADVWTSASRTLSDYATSTITAAIWANGSRTLTNYGNDITAADVWNVLSSTLSTVGTVGNQLSGNVDATISSRATTSTATNPATAWSVTMSNVERVQTGKVYRTKVFILNSDSTPTTPVSVPTVNLYDDMRNLVVSNIPMTQISTGVYEYTYSVSTLAAQGLWETVVSTQVESGKTIQTNDYWEVSGSPAQVIINSVISPNPSSISGNITITNEGLTGYEYQYEWCVVDNVNNQCGGGDDVFHSLAAKYINPGESWNTALTGSVPTAGTYYFKLVVYFGADSSSASRIFTVESGTGTPVSGVGSSGSGSSGGGNATPATSSSEGCGISADLNQDCKVNIVDLSILLSFWKKNPPFKNVLVDINKDNKVNSADFSIMLSQWNKKK